MSRFGYLKVKSGGPSGGRGRREARKAEKRARKALAQAQPGPPDAADPSTGGRAGEPVSVYVRRETVRAVWREVKRDGGESVSELVEDLLLAWLRERTR